ncbi:MAG: hypothetical protein ACLFWM_11180, partial [Actinomycetota bacterium]
MSTAEKPDKPGGHTPATGPRDTETRDLVARLVAADSDGDHSVRDVVRVELEDRLIRSRRDPLLVAAERWSVRLTNALRRAERVENQLARLRQRRWFRLSDALARLVSHPLRLRAILPDLREGMAKRPLPQPKVVPDVRLQPPRVAATSQPPQPYLHVRMGHGGRIRTFDGLIRHIEIPEAQGMAPGAFDLLVLEPGMGDLLTEVPLDLLDRLQQAEVPTVLFARTPHHLDLPHTRRVSLVVTEDPDLAESAPVPALTLEPSVDPRLHHPIGWQRDPARELIDLDSRPGLWGEELTREIKSHRVATTRHAAMALIATAAGTPVVTPRTPHLDRLLGDLYVPVDMADEVHRAVEAIRDTQTRERLSGAARRHVLN